jgi:hypothetical protein
MDRSTALPVPTPEQSHDVFALPPTALEAAAPAEGRNAPSAGLPTTSNTHDTGSAGSIDGPVGGPRDHAHVARQPTFPRPPREAGAGGGLASNLAEDRDRIAADLNDGLINHMFAISLDLHTALTLLGGHEATKKINFAISGLDQAIKDLRSTVYDLGPPA